MVVRFGQQWQLMAKVVTRTNKTPSSSLNGLQKRGKRVAIILWLSSANNTTISTQTLAFIIPTAKRSKVVPSVPCWSFEQKSTQIILNIYFYWSYNKTLLICMMITRCPFLGRKQETTVKRRNLSIFCQELIRKFQKK